MRIALSYIFFYACLTCAVAQNITRVEYFINTDPGFGNGTAVTGYTPSGNISSFNFNINLSSVPGGFNTAYIRAKDANGIWSLSNKITFIKISFSKIVKAEYFINTDPGFGNATTISLPHNFNINNHSAILNVTGAPDGMNILRIRAQDSLGAWSLTNVIPFIKHDMTLPLNIVALEYFTDIDPGFGMGTAAPLTPSTDISNYSFNADLSGVDTGSHSLFIRGKDINGKWSLTNIISFYKTPGIGIAEIKTHNLNVYPNPSAGKFNISIPENVKIKKIEVMDADAKTVLTTETLNREQVIDLSNKSSGVYFIKTTADNNTVIYQRIIKQ